MPNICVGKILGGQEDTPQIGEFDLSKRHSTDEYINRIERQIKGVEQLTAGRSLPIARQQQAGTHAGSEADTELELLSLKKSLEKDKEEILKRLSAAGEGGADQE